MSTINRQHTADGGRVQYIYKKWFKIETSVAFKQSNTVIRNTQPHQQPGVHGQRRHLPSVGAF